MTPVVTIGFGPGANKAFVVTLGFGPFTPAPAPSSSGGLTMRSIIRRYRPFSRRCGRRR